MKYAKSWDLSTSRIRESWRYERSRTWSSQPTKNLRKVRWPRPWWPRCVSREVRVRRKRSQFTTSWRTRQLRTEHRWEPHSLWTAASPLVTAWLGWTTHSARVPLHLRLATRPLSCSRSSTCSRGLLVSRRIGPIKPAISKVSTLQ